MINIVKAEEKHIPEICQLWWEFIQHHADIEPFFAPAGNALEGFEREFLRPALQNEKGLFLVALDMDIAVGYAFARITEIPYKNNQPIGYVDQLAVTAGYRRKGIGERLYREIVDWFRSASVRRIHLELTAKNRAACSFWRKQGYQDLQHTWYCEI